MEENGGTRRQLENEILRVVRERGRSREVFCSRLELATLIDDTDKKSAIPRLAIATTIEFQSNIYEKLRKLFIWRTIFIFKFVNFGVFLFFAGLM